MKPVLLALTLVCTAAVLAPPAAGALSQDPPAPVEPAEEKPQDAPLPSSQPTESVFPKHAPTGASLKPPNPGPPLIDDIDKARVEPLPYVSRMAELVPTRFGNLDVNADPVLWVGDRAVSRTEFRRRALLYLSGPDVDMEITRALTQREIRRQTAAGVDPAVFAPDVAALDQKIEEQKEMIRMRFQQQDGNAQDAELAIKNFIDSINASPGGMEAYRELLTADVQFEKVFLPFPKTKVEGVKHDPATGPPPVDEPRPDWMPESSWSAMSHDEAGRNLRSFVKTWSIDGEELSMLFKPSIVDKLRSGLIAEAGVAFFFDEDMPDDAFLRVGDERVQVDDMWARANVPLVDADVDLIVRELIMLDGMRESLQAAGRWIERDAFDEAFKQHEAEYAATIFPLKTIIIFRGYTSVDRYREHYRYRLAFNNWKTETVADEELRRHYEQGGRLFFERGVAQVDIAYLALGEKPFNDASLEATRQELQRAIDEARAGAGEGAAPAGWFAKVKEKYPPPVSDQSDDNVTFQRSQLRMQLAEDELSIFLTGYSLADDLIYHGHPGELFPPWPQRCRRHAWGAEPNAGSWAVLVNGYRIPKPLDAFEGAQKAMAREDYIDLNYFQWSRDCLATKLAQVKRPPSAAGAEESPAEPSGSPRAWMYILGVGAVLIVVAATRRK